MQDTRSQQFIREFEQSLQSFQLPAGLTGRYTLKSIFKDTAEKQVCLLSDTQEHLFILKIRKGPLHATLRQEYEILCQLSAPCFPKPVDFFEETDCAYLLRTYISGISLYDYAEHLYESRPDHMDFEGALLPLLIECCNIIHELHKLHPPVIHRDIKGENFVWDSGQEQLFLIDVDAGHQFSPAKSRDTVFAGTYGHAAPEQFGFGQSDVRTDVYGLGRMFLTLLGESDTTNAEISQELSSILHKACSFEPAQRFSTVSELKQALVSLQKKRTKAPEYGRKRAALLLSAGLLAGSSLGSGLGIIISQRLLSKQVLPASTGQIAADSASADPVSADPVSADPVSASPVSADPVSTDETDTPADTSGSSVSLAEQAGVSPLELFDYQDNVDAILIDAYDNDADRLAEDVDTLVQKLYAEPELTRNPPEDYSGSDTRPEPATGSAPIDYIKLSLVYRDRLLEKTIGSYDTYSEDILSSLRTVLYRTDDAEQSSIYIYAHMPKDQVVNKELDYYFCLSDLLDNILRSIDIHDGFFRAFEQN